MVYTVCIEYRVYICVTNALAHARNGCIVFCLKFACCIKFCWRRCCCCCFYVCYFSYSAVVGVFECKITTLIISSDGFVNVRKMRKKTTSWHYIHGKCCIFFSKFQKDKVKEAKKAVKKGFSLFFFLVTCT